MRAKESRPFGVYYRPDTEHYREADLAAHLPLWQQAGVKWLVVRGSAARAVPEAFVKGVLRAEMTPFLHLPIPLNTPLAEIRPMLRAYARWGVRQVAFFDRPNLRTAWPGQWEHPDLPGRFLDAFVPFAAAAVAEGMTPFFPPLQPGGDYWDLAFLRAALEGLRRRDAALAAQIGISAYAWSEGRPLSWGRGGPEVWPQAQPYLTPQGSEDHRGFRIFEWYAVEARAALRQVPPIFLLGMGSRYGREAAQTVEEKNAAIVRLFVAGDLPQSVIGGAFWLWTADAGSPEAEAAWVLPSGAPRQMIASLRQAIAEAASPAPSTAIPKGAPRHYVLLPSLSAETSLTYLSAALPWLQRGAATVGFQIEEALQASQITVVGQPNDFPPEVQQALRQAKARVRWVTADGTEIAAPKAPA